MTPNKSFPFSRKTTLIIGSITVLLLAFTVTIFLTHHADNVKKTDAAALDAPKYTTVLPAGKSIASLGGWKRISPADKDPVYAYVDSIDDVAINVSEQPLPASFTNDVDSDVADLAKKFNATTKLEASSVDAYIGTSATGPQSVIFTKKSVLVLIKSKEKVDDKTWVSYIDSLN